MTRTKNKVEQTSSASTEDFFNIGGSSVPDMDFDEQKQESEFDFRPLASTERMSIINRLDEDLITEYGGPFPGISKRCRQEILFYITSEFENRFTQPMLLELVQAKTEFDYKWAGMLAMRLERMPVTASIDAIRKKMEELQGNAEQGDSHKEFSFGIPRWSIGIIWGASILASLAVGSMLSSDVSNYYGESYKNTMPSVLPFKEAEPLFMDAPPTVIIDKVENLTPADK